MLGCWVVLVFPRLFFWKNAFFFPIRDLRHKKKVYTTYTKKKFPWGKKRDLRQKKSYATYAKKKEKSDLRLFSQSSYAFLFSLYCLLPYVQLGFGMPLGVNTSTRLLCNIARTRKPKIIHCPHGPESLKALSLKETPLCVYEEG